MIGQSKDQSRAVPKDPKHVVSPVEPSKIQNREAIPPNVLTVIE